MIHLIATLTLLAPTAPGAALGASPSPGPAASAFAPAEDTYDALLAEYDAAYDAWKDELGQAADRARRKELRANHPAAAYAPRFRALGEAGEGRALLWQLDHLRHLDLALRERDPQRDAWYRALFEQHVAEPWFGDALTQAWGDRRRFEAAQFDAWLASARDGNESKEVQAQARYYLAYDAVRSDDEAEQARGFAALDALVAELPDTSFAEAARRDLFQMRDCAVGALAIDFEGTTVDGETFRLSDFRGKVVLLDFWGFW